MSHPPNDIAQRPAIAILVTGHPLAASNADAGIALEVLSTRIDSLGGIEHILRQARRPESL